MKHKKRILIIVHGVWPIKFRNKLLEKIRSKILGILTSDRGIISSDYHLFERFVKKFYDEINFLRWDGRLFKNPDLITAEKRLTNLLNRNIHNEIDIIAFSLGGFIVQNSVLISKKIKVHHLIFVGAVHKRDIILNNVKKIFNVYSKKDLMFKFANDIYEGFGNIDLRGKNVKNIALRDMDHNDLCKNKLIFFNHKKRTYLYKLYVNLLNL